MIKLILLILPVIIAYYGGAHLSAKIDKEEPLDLKKSTIWIISGAVFIVSYLILYNSFGRAMEGKTEAISIMAIIITIGAFLGLKSNKFKKIK